MKAASIRRETSGTQMTTSTGALRLIDIVGSISAIMPVSRGGTECARLITDRETHLFALDCNGRRARRLRVMYTYASERLIEGPHSRGLPQLLLNREYEEGDGDPEEDQS